MGTEKRRATNICCVLAAKS